MSGLRGRPGAPDGRCQRVRLLFDQNLSPRLVEYLRDIFPGSSHVAAVGLDRASDDTVRDYAAHHGYLLVTKDADFGELNVWRGPPPKVVWLRLGNCSTRRIEEALRRVEDAVAALEADRTVSVLIVFPPRPAYW